MTDSSLFGDRVSLDQVIHDTEAALLDIKSSALHRAALHGDIDVMKKILDTQPKIDHIDQSGRTPLHVAAYQGKHEALAFLIHQVDGDEGILRLEDNTGRTAFEILTAYDPITDTHRSQVVGELYEDCLAAQHRHSLAARHLGTRHYLGLYLPGLVSTILCALFSLAYSDAEMDAEARRGLAALSGLLATLAVFFNVTRHVSELGPRAAMHASAAHDLQDLLTELKFEHLTGFVFGDEGEAPPVDIPGIKCRLDAIEMACKSDMPFYLEELFDSLRKQLHHFLLQARVERNSEDFRLLRDLAYNRAEITTTHTIFWPWRVPNPKHASERVMLTVRKCHRSALPPQLRLHKGGGTGKVSWGDRRGGGGALNKPPLLAKPKASAAPAPAAPPKPVTEGMLMLRTDPLCLECELKSEGAVRLAAPEIKAAAQLWHLDANGHLSPLKFKGTPAPAKAPATGGDNGGGEAKAPSAAAVEKLVLDVPGADAHNHAALIMYPMKPNGAAGNKNQTWMLTADYALESKLGGEHRFVGFSGDPGKPKKGDKLVLVSENSWHKIRWKWGGV